MKNNISFFSIIFITLFLALCVFPWVDTIFKADQGAALSENRQLAALPEFPSGIRALNQLPEKFNASFNDNFGFRRWLLQTHGSIMVNILKTSPNPKVVLGSNNWFFYEPDIRYLTSFDNGGFVSANRSSSPATAVIEKSASPLKAIIDFNRQLRDRNIRLVLLPVPVKPMFYSAELSSPFTKPVGYLQNPAFTQLKSDLEKENILILDIAGLLEELKKTTQNPVFLKTDTHWSPETVTATARRIESFIAEHTDLSLHNSGKLEMREMEISNIGDLASMLPITKDSNPEYVEKTTIRQIVSNEGEPWVPDRNAEILFLGDSFANIYSLGTMGWGESAGLVEQLSFFLNRPVDRIIQNDNGAFATRQALQYELSRGRDRLAGKEVVIWEFAVRELVTGDWKMLDMKLGEKKAGAFFTPAPGEVAVVSGVIDNLSEKPVPGKSPYKDHVMSLHLVDVTIGGNNAENREALVYIFSMKDNKLTNAVNYQTGQKITVRLHNWNDVSDIYGSLNRSEIDDENLMIADPCWGEEIKK
jgi:hypothetical protein